MNITIYTITDCPFSKQEKDFLTAKGLKFEEKNVQQNREFLTEMLEVSNKFAGVPFTIIEKDNGEKVNLKGFTQSEFEQALGGGAPAGTPPTPAKPAPAVVAAPVGDKAPAGTPPSPAVPTPPSMPNPTPSSMPDALPNMPSMPGIDEAPKNSSFDKAPLGGMPPMPSMPSMPQSQPKMSPPPSAPSSPAAKPMPDLGAPKMPSTPAMPSTPPTPAGGPTTAPADPQGQLDGLLADLQSKTQPDLPDLPPQQ